MLCLSGFELYSCWVPLTSRRKMQRKYFSYFTNEFLKQILWVKYMFVY